MMNADDPHPGDVDAGAPGALRVAADRVDVQAEAACGRAHLPTHRMASAIGTTIGTPSIGNDPGGPVLVEQEHDEPADADDPGPDAQPQQADRPDRHPVLLTPRAVVERRCRARSRR